MSIITLSRLKTVLFITMVTLTGFRSAGAFSPTGDDWKRNLGREDHIAYIVLDDLRTPGDVDRTVPLTILDSKLEMSTFYSKFDWVPNICLASSVVLKEGVTAYCLPYARLGQYYPKPGNPSAKFFSRMGEYAGVYVWHVPHQNNFYVWTNGWNSRQVLGPFLGDPRISLPLAVKPRKGQRSFPGVTLELVSQRWLYPDDRDARVPRNAHWDCAHGHMSGKVMERIQLNTFINRFRLTSRGATDIYYQTVSEDSDIPTLCQLLDPLHTNSHLRHPLNANWGQALRTDYFCDLGGLAWRKLARGAVIDFERTDFAFAQGTAGFVLLINELADYWDANKLLGTYPVMYGRE